MTKNQQSAIGAIFLCFGLVANAETKSNEQWVEYFLDQIEEQGLRFGINLNKQQEQDLYNAVKKEGYGKAKLKTVEKKVKDKEITEK